MVLETNSRQWLSKIVSHSEKLVEIIKEADSICHYCAPVSPLVCVERCEIWNTKNEFFRMNGRLGKEEHLHELLNAVKNDRRQEVVEALYKRPLDIKGLQECLKNKGYYHSQHTVASEYLEPLVNAGLIKREVGRYRLTLYGQRFRKVLKSFNFKNPLPPHSRCHEEKVLEKLKEGPKTFADLAGALSQKSLSRSLKRLADNDLVKRSKTAAHVFYHRTKKVPKKLFSPTEERIYKNIPEIGVSARELSNKVGINLRRTYKYLRRLRRRRLAFTRKKPRIYELTPSGMELAGFLEETRKLVLDATKASAFLLERSKQTTQDTGPSSMASSPKLLRQPTS